MSVSRDPEKRAAQLANLPNLRGEPTSTTWRPGDSPALTNGLRSRAPAPTVVDPIVREIEAALLAAAPLRDASGEVPAVDRFAVELAALALLRVRRVHAYLATNGEIDAEGRLRTEIIEGARKAEETAGRMLDKLGMSPRSRVALGLDLTRAATATDLLHSHVAAHYVDGQAADVEPAALPAATGEPATPAGGAPFTSPSTDAGASAHPSTTARPTENPEGQA